jgi:UDP-N-acetylmuramoyl-L-alanyl-D-glutamate--2,6-diaminopimelate ligase
MEEQNRIDKKTTAAEQNKTAVSVGGRVKKTYAKIVAAFYGNPARKLQIIAVSGSSGKSEAANLINEVLKEAGYKTAMLTAGELEITKERQKNHEAIKPSTSLYQRFLSVAKKRGAEYVILEVDHFALKKDYLADVPLWAAVLTNFSNPHPAYVTSEEYATVKSKLLHKLPKYTILNYDDEWFDYFNQYKPLERTILFGRNRNSDIRIDRVKFYKRGTEMQAFVRDKYPLSVATFFTTEASPTAMSAAIAIGDILNIPPEKMQNGIANLEI